MQVNELLPFECPACGERFGLGPDAVLLAVVSVVPINGEPAPCCASPLWGELQRNADGLLSLTAVTTETA